MQYYIEPNEFEETRAMGELIISIAAGNLKTQEPIQSPFFFTECIVVILCIFVFNIMTTLLPNEVTLLDLFIRELYGEDIRIELEELLRNDEDQYDEDEDEDEEAKEEPPKYEDKYLKEYKKLEKVELSQDFVEGLVNSFVIEYTPSGNVIMKYDSKKETFEYYSDNVIPYRFLEVVCRKYVRSFNCAALYKDAEVCVVETKETKEIKGTKEETDKNDSSKPSSSVFAKFKSYNNGASKSEALAHAAPQKKRDAGPPSVVLSGNRFTACGKIANMTFLKKVDKKVVDKNYKLSFADFKKLQQTTL